WLPMLILAGLFFVVIPTFLLFAITHVHNDAVVAKVATTLDVLPARAKAAIHGFSPAGRTSYALAVYLFAPLAVIVPMTISTAVGANALVGEKERGTGEFLAHSPATEREIYLGKLIASLLPGYLTTIIGFGIYALIVNLIVGPQVGGWFFPTSDWWVLMFWVVPPFLAITLCVVLRLSARVRHRRLRPVQWRPARRGLDGHRAGGRGVDGSRVGAVAGVGRRDAGAVAWRGGPRPVRTRPAGV
ncbi:MAG: hypothetical protein E6G57_13950, partial [Actinobacteria bacterium]